MLTQVREDEVTIKSRARAHFASRFWGVWDLGKARKYFLKPVIKVVNSEYWAGSAKIFLGFQKKLCNRKTGKVLSQFPVQLTLNTDLYNESTQAGWWPYSWGLGRNRAGLPDWVTDSIPCFLLPFYPRTSQKSFSATRGVWQTEALVTDSSCPLPNHGPWHVQRAKRNVTRLFWLVDDISKKANKHSPSPLKNESGWRQTSKRKPTHMQTGIENIFTLFALQPNGGEGERGSPGACQCNRMIHVTILS